MKIKEQVITSRSNPLVMSVVKLRRKQHRDSEGLFLCDGKKLCREYIKKCGAPKFLIIDETKLDTLTPFFEEVERCTGVTLEPILVSNSAFEKMTEEKSAEGVICVCGYDTVSVERIGGGFFSDNSEKIIILSSLRDAGNVGTVIRTALALSYDRIILSDDCADVLSPKVLRASMGALFSVKITLTGDLCDTVERIKKSGRRVFSAELREKAVSIKDINVLENDVFVIGNEGHGIDAEVSRRSSKSVYIPINDRSESLNAAVAASIIMWHQTNV